jgi:hypothetical protein
MNDYIKSVEASLRLVRESLAPLESGQMRMGKREPGKEWQDVTQEWIQRHKQNIAMYQQILEALRSRKSP